MTSRTSNTARDQSGNAEGFRGDERKLSIRSRASLLWNLIPDSWGLDHRQEPACSWVRGPWIKWWQQGGLPRVGGLAWRKASLKSPITPISTLKAPLASVTSSTLRLGEGSSRSHQHMIFPSPARDQSALPYRQSKASVALASHPRPAEHREFSIINLEMRVDFITIYARAGFAAAWGLP